MPDRSDKSASSTGSEASHDENAVAPNAKRQFESPELLAADPDLDDAEKLALLQDWDVELTNRLRAEEEGMSASDPIGERKEARFADEAARVKTLIVELSKRLEAS